MTVEEFIQMERSGAVFLIIDATRPGYITFPYVIDELGKQEAQSRYGKRELLGFSARAKNKVELYVK